jgi:hypothetical protein
VIPFLLAATPLQVGSPVPFQDSAPLRQDLPAAFGVQVPVEEFDPVARAAELAQQLPRQWSGTYQPFAAGVAPATVQLNLTSVIAMGQMVDFRGEITVGSVSMPVQGNLNAKSDQLDLLLLGGNEAVGLENGGYFLGLQGFDLSGWRAPRFTNLGGALQLTQMVEPSPAPRQSPGIRGLW